MSGISTEASELERMIKLMAAGAASVETARSRMKSQYRQMGAQWKDQKYRELGDIVQECDRALREIQKIMLHGEKCVVQLLKQVQEYEAVSLDGGSSAPVTRHLSGAEVNSRWAATQSFVSEMIDSYRTELNARKIPNGPMLDKFLAQHQSRMLQYEGAFLNHAGGEGGEPSGEEVYRYPIVGADSPYSYDDLANEYGAFCLNEARSWLGDINPGFSNPFIPPRNNPYRVNCGSCAFAVESRLNGNEQIVATAQNIGTDSGMEAATGRRCVYMSVDSIENYLREHGPGSHLIVGINRHPRPDGQRQAGHWFNAIYDGQNFHTIDGQSGQVYDWPHDYIDISEWCALVE